MIQLPSDERNLASPTERSDASRLGPGSRGSQGAELGAARLAWRSACAARAGSISDRRDRGRELSPAWIHMYLDIFYLHDECGRHTASLRMYDIAGAGRRVTASPPDRDVDPVQERQTLAHWHAPSWGHGESARRLLAVGRYSSSVRAGAGDSSNQPRSRPVTSSTARLASHNLESDTQYGGYLKRATSRTSAESVGAW